MKNIFISNTMRGKIQPDAEIVLAIMQDVRYTLIL